MKKLLVIALLGVSFSFLLPLGSGQQKKSETIVHEVTAEGIAKEFRQNEKAAKTKYDPKGPKGGAGGAVIDISGEVQKVTGTTVVLRSIQGITVTLQATSVAGKVGETVQATGATFKSYSRKVLLIKCGKVEKK
jgi:hypothetical protein